MGKIPRGMQKMGRHHIHIVNALHSSIKEGLRPLRGVTAKNPPLYLAWFRFIYRNRGAAKPRQLLLDAITVPVVNKDL